MKPSSHLLLIPFLQLVTSGDAQCSLDFAVGEKIRGLLRDLIFLSTPSPLPQSPLSHPFGCGFLSSMPCHAGYIVIRCSCGYACGSWDVQGYTCLCQCNPVGWWATARCCHLI
uniref:Resistin n=1 Tax=Equus asinus TaxID=9793 RepID=A0A9L0IWJ8_EQUAS